MSTTPTIKVASDKDRWMRLALRHLRMTAKLASKGLHDGACFHAYHAFECTASAFIAFKGSKVPPDGKRKKRVKGRGLVSFYPCTPKDIENSSTHTAKVKMFDQLADKTSLYYRQYVTMSRFSSTLRNDTLYYNTGLTKLPHEIFSKTDAEDMFRDALSFLTEVRRAT
jgi:HEPN domain-containing protein